MDRELQLLKLKIFDQMAYLFLFSFFQKRETRH
jgi:hypothetical protein